LFFSQPSSFFALDERKEHLGVLGQMKSIFANSKNLIEKEDDEEK
jgi:hypothetical protein